MVRKAENGADQLDRERSKRVSALAELWPFLRPYRALLGAAMVALVLPMAVRRVVDNFGTEDGALLDQYFGGALFIAALLALGTGARYLLVTRLGERVVADIRKAVFDRVIGMSPAFFERLMTGEVLSRITTDTTLILSVIGSSISIALRNLLSFIGGMALMLLTSAKLTGLVLLIVPLVIFPILFLGRKMRVLSRENQDWIANSSGNASEALLSVQTEQAFTNEGERRARFADVTERSHDAARRRVNTRALMSVIVIVLVFTGIVGVLWSGAREVRAGDMTPGSLVQFGIYSVMVAGAVAALSEIWGEVQRAAGATERLVELLQADDPVKDPAAPVAVPHPARGGIEFDGVRFAYPAPPETPALDDFNLSIKPVETVALVGPSGAGKTSVIQLIQRFYDPDEGRITLDGVALSDMARHAFRDNLALVPQDPVIFAASARENIRFGRLDASDAEIEAAARAANAHEFIAQLPEGYDTYVGERGVMLSGGQKQRIAIARAI